MFFYRPWVGSDDQREVTPPEYAIQFAYHRWGYAALLLLTLLGGVLLNSSIIGAFAFDWKNLKKMPHLVIFMLCIRDLLVSLVLIPMCVNWYIVNLGVFSGGHVLCAFAAFFDFTMAAEYALILVVLAVVLLTRKFPKIEDLSQLPMEEMITRSPPASLSYPNQRRTPSRQMSNGSRPGSVQGSRPPSVQGSRQGSRAPSVAGSTDGYRGQTSRGGRNGQFLNVPNGPRRPGSVTGSIEGRLATSTPTGGGRPGGRQFMAASPLHEETEEDMDLWDAASLDYPGRQSPGMIDEWDEREDELIFYDEPRYHQWHKWLLISTWLGALAFGIPAAMYVESKAPQIPTGPNYGYGPVPNIGVRPGCYIKVDPFGNQNRVTIVDPGFNFSLSFIIVEYFCTFAISVLLLCMICYKETKSPKYKRFVKILIGCLLIFMISRSPIDILQFKGLIEVAMGFFLRSITSYELEHEILLIWTTYIPILLHPILFLSFVSEYRIGAMKSLRTLCGCQRKYEEKQQAKIDKYKTDEIMSERSAVSKTQMSNIL